MARKEHRPQGTRHEMLTPQQTHCPTCGGSFWAAYHTRRTILTLQGLWQLTLVVRRCHNQHCQKVHEAIVEQGQLDLVHVQADEILVKGWKLMRRASKGN